MFSLKKKSKTPVQKKKQKKKRWNMKNCIALHYFRVSGFVFCGHGLYFWILFQFCGLIL